MTFMPERLPELYSTEEEHLMQIGARLILMKLLESVDNGWNGYGTKLWAERQMEEMDGRSDDSLLLSE